MREIFFRNTLARIAHLNPNFIAFLSAAQGDGAAHFDGLRRVYEQVHKHLIECAGRQYMSGNVAYSLTTSHLYFSSFHTTFNVDSRP